MATYDNIREVQELRNDIALIDEQLKNVVHCNSRVILEEPPHEPKELQLDEADSSDFTTLLTKCKSGIQSNTNNCLVLNLACYKALKAIEKNLINTLERNKREQDEIVKLMKRNPSKEVNDKLLCIVKNVGMPYFKDKNGFGQPYNDDVKTKLLKREALPSDLKIKRKVWTEFSVRTLKAAVLASAKKTRLTILLERRKKIHQGKQETDERVQLSNINCEINTLNQAKTLNIQDKEIDWLKISTTDLQGHFSDTECRLKWSVIFDPKTNKSKWKQVELTHLYSLAKQFHEQDWDQIAVYLDRNRSSLQCCVKYMEKNSVKNDAWSREENEMLCQLVKRYQVRDNINWRKVAWFFQLRSLKQCKEHYVTLESTKKGFFDAREDLTICKGIVNTQSFLQIARLLPGRTPKQVKARFETLTRSLTPFTVEDDALLVKLSNMYACKWPVISRYFTNHSSQDCKIRWLKLKKDFGRYDKNDTSMVIPPLALNQEGKLTAFKDWIAKFLKPRPGRPRLGYKLGMSDEDSDLPKLIKFLGCCYAHLFGPKPRKVDSIEDLAHKMKVSLIVLQADTMLSTNHLSIIEQASSNGYFNCEETRVLTHLTGHLKEAPGSYSMWRLPHVPPNYCTLLGLRTLFQARPYILNTSNFSSSPPFDCKTTINEKDRLLFLDAKKRWEHRLQSLFLFPLICSVIKHPETLEIVPKKRPKPRPMSKKKLKEHASFMAYRSKLKKENVTDATSKQEVLRTLAANKRKVGQPTHEGVVKRKPGRPRKVVPVVIENIPPADAVLELPVKRARMIRVLPA